MRESNNDEHQWNEATINWHLEKNQSLTYVISWTIWEIQKAQTSKIVTMEEEEEKVGKYLSLTPRKFLHNLT